MIESELREQQQKKIPKVPDISALVKGNDWGTWILVVKVPNASFML